MPDALARLPHTGPARLPDRVVRLEPGKRVVAERSLAAGDDCLNGDDRLPAVLLVELMAQAGGLLLEDEGPGARAYLAGVKRMHLHGTAGAGETITVTCSLQRRLGDIYLIDGDCSSGARRLAHGSVQLRRIHDATA